MAVERYETRVTEDVLVFEFVSIGPKGEILKRVIYQHVEDDLYNLAFGDATSDGFINDEIVTNNNDTSKVLATVAMTIFDFFTAHEGTIVLVKGSTHLRTRLYRWYLTQFLTQINQDFVLFSELYGEIKRFQKNMDYPSFSITKK